MIKLLKKSMKPKALVHGNNGLPHAAPRIRHIWSFGPRRGWRSTVPTPEADLSSQFVQAAGQVHVKVIGRG